MVFGTEVDGTADGREASPAPEPGRAWVLLPVAWCVWLLLWILPSLVVGPRLAWARPWMMRETALSALVAAAAFFLVAVWPFWPALASGPGRQTLSGRWLGLSLFEFALLVALAGPFALVAWSVSGGTVAAAPTVVAVLGLGVFGLGLRVATAGMAPRMTRWLVLAAMTVLAGPLMLEYATREALGVTCGWLVGVSPLFGLVRIGLDGWPEGPWLSIARLWLWPGVGVVLATVGLLESRRRRRRAASDG